VSVLVVGGGPAGSAAALTLLGVGIDVTILERARFPRYRPGETLHPGIEPLLDQLGACSALRDGDPLRHTGHWVAWHGPERFVPFGADEAGPWHGFQVPRARLDAALLATAVRNGARLLVEDAPREVCVDDRRVRGIDVAGDRLHARFTIDCSGDTHWLARALGIGFAYHSPRLLARFGYANGAVASLDRLPLIESDPGGWTWLAEVERGNFHWTRVTRYEDRPADGWLPPALRACTPTRTRGADVTWRIARRSAGPGWLLAGDAAAVLDPSSSHGVLRALMTGMMAGHVVRRIVCENADEERCTESYRRWLDDWFHGDVARMAHAYAEAKLFGFDADDGAVGGFTAA